VKRCIADGSVRFPHVRVGHRQALYQNPDLETGRGFTLCSQNTFLIHSAVLRRYHASSI
jgi:hypothetical protein